MAGEVLATMLEHELESVPSDPTRWLALNRTVNGFLYAERLEDVFRAREALSDYMQVRYGSDLLARELRPRSEQLPVFDVATAERLEKQLLQARERYHDGRVDLYGLL